MRCGRVGQSRLGEECSCMACCGAQRQGMAVMVLHGDARLGEKRSGMVRCGTVWQSRFVKACSARFGMVGLCRFRFGSQGGARYLWLGDVRSGMACYGKAVKFRSGM